LFGSRSILGAALDINPNNPYTLLNLGVVIQDTGRTKEAIQMYQKVLELNPEETAVKSNREGYSGKNIVEIARLNLKSLGVFIAQKDPALNTKDLGESVVTDSKANTMVLPYEAPLQIVSHSAAVYASALGSEGGQDTVEIASVGGPGDGDDCGDGDDGYGDD